MAEHRVQFKTRSCEVTRGDRIVFSVSGNRAKLGELHVSAQGIAWMAKGARKGRKITWEDFSRVMKDVGGWKVPR